MTFKFTRDSQGNRIISTNDDSPSSMEIDGLVAHPEHPSKYPFANILRFARPPENAILRFLSVPGTMPESVLMAAGPRPFVLAIDFFKADPGIFLCALKRTWPLVTSHGIARSEYIEAYVLDANITRNWAAQFDNTTLGAALISETGYRSNLPKYLKLEVEDGEPQELRGCTSTYTYSEGPIRIGAYRVYFDVSFGFWHGQVWVPQPDLYEVSELPNQRVIRARKRGEERRFAMPADAEWNVSHPLGSWIREYPAFVKQLPESLLAFREI